MFFKNNRDLETVDSFLDDLSSYVNGDLNKIEDLALKNSGSKEGAVYEKLANIVSTIQNKDRDNLGIYGEIMLIMEKVSDGYMSDRITVDTSDNKLAYIKSVLNTFFDKIDKSFKDISKMVVTMQNGDYRVRIDDTIFRGGEAQEMLTGLNKLAEEFSKSAKLSKDSAENLSASGIVLEQQIETLSTSSNEQAASLEESAASIEEITGNIRSTTDKSMEIQKLSTESSEALNSGIDLARQTSTAMKDINSSTTSISEAITVIDQIAFQTNILSLNAAVEAATAGEAGKGFAVVAGEVRNLAAKSAEAASEIKSIVELSQAKATQGNEVATQMLKGYEEMSVKIESTSKLIEDVSNASKEQMQGMDQINISVAQLDQMTQENTRVASEVQSIAQEVNRLATDMNNLVSDKQF